MNASPDPGRPRYAIYVAPKAETDLYVLGRRWLAHDVVTGEPLEAPDLPAISPADHARIVRAPTRYGFHGTLKPPFHLGDGVEERELLDAAAEFAATRSPFDLPPLQLTTLRDFLALMLSEPSPDLQSLADACVSSFDRFRAPIAEYDGRRYDDVDLTEPQRGYVAKFGYPYVFEEFRFHMTLTSPLTAMERESLFPVLQGYWSPVLGRPVPVPGIAVFRAPKFAGSYKQIGFFDFAA
jgi:hypothetical protein